MTRYGKLSKRVGEPRDSDRWPMRAPNASGSGGALAACSAGLLHCQELATVTPRSDAITLPALPPAAAAPVPIVKASVGLLWKGLIIDGLRNE